MHVQTGELLYIFPCKANYMVHLSPTHRSAEMHESVGRNVFIHTINQGWKYWK